MCRKKSNQISYTLGIPSDAYRCLASQGKKLCTQVHPSKEPYIQKHILLRTTYPKYILTRIYVSQTHPSEKLCTPRVYFHHLTRVTYKHAVHMRCHHKKNSIIGFQAYSKHIPLRSYVSKYILLRSHVHPVDPSEELCIPYTSLLKAMYPKGVLSPFHLRYIQVCNLHEMSS